MEIQNGYKLGVYIKRIVFYVRDWIAICHVSSVLKMLLGWMGTYVNKNCKIQTKMLIEPRKPKMRL